MSAARAPSQKLQIGSAALLRCNKPSAKVLTIFTILALARPTSSPNHLHQFRLRPPDILAFIASTTAATISSARALSASSFTQPTFDAFTWLLRGFSFTWLLRCMPDDAAQRGHWRLLQGRWAVGLFERRHLARGVGQGGRRTISERSFTRSD